MRPTIAFASVLGLPTGPVLARLREGCGFDRKYGSVQPSCLCLPGGIALIALGVLAASLFCSAQSLGRGGVSVESARAPVNHWTRKAANASEFGVARVQAIIDARGRYFDSEIGTPEPLSSLAGEAGERGGFAFDHIFSEDPFPANESDLVITGDFVEYQSTLSPSTRSVYSIVRFRLDQVLKSAVRSLIPADVIEVLFPGGTVQLSDGRTVQYAVEAGDDVPLELHSQYLLFLRYNRELDSYAIVKHWKLDAGRLVPVDLLEVQRIAHKSAVSSMSVAEALRRVSEIIQSRQNR